ncbi:hypothetical protein KAH37_07730 [bacterium]|nr:hypothetical protein [bacterium]
MREKTLLTPPHIPIIQKFLAFAHADILLPQREIIKRVCRAFSRLPYENLTKISGSDGVGAGHKRYPERVLNDFFTYGSGGTCFSLTATLIELLSAMNIPAYPILADRHYGPNTHCAVLLTIDTDFYLVDPGYLIFQPILIPIAGSVRYPGLFNTVELTASEDGKEVALHTILNNDRRYRMSYKLAPVESEKFEKAWEDSFLFEMMSYPVLTLVSDNKQIYLQGDTIKIRADGKQRKEKITSDEGQKILSSLEISDSILKTLYNRGTP